MSKDILDILVEISDYVTKNGVTSLNGLIRACEKEGHRDWLSYISGRPFVAWALVSEELNRQRGGTMPVIPDDVEAGEQP